MYVAVRRTPATIAAGLTAGGAVRPAGWMVDTEGAVVADERTVATAAAPPRPVSPVRSAVERLRLRGLLARLGVAACVGLALVLFKPGRPALASDDEVSVPIVLQAKLLGRVLSYDRNFLRRAGGRAHVLLIMRADDPDSVQVVAELRTELARIDFLGGLPHDERTLAYTNPSDLSAACKAERISVVYLGPGLRGQTAPIRDALSNLDVLSVAAVAAYVREGMVLGFGVQSGHPRMIVNLPQSRLQNVQFTADALNLMTVIR